MVAEILLYSKLYNLLQRVGTSDIRGMGTEEGGELQTWRENWNYLFRTSQVAIPTNLSRGRSSISRNRLLFRSFDVTRSSSKVTRRRSPCRWDPN
jgi:hypothetical protein